MASINSDPCKGVSMRKLCLVIVALALASSASSAQGRKDNWDNLKQLQAGHKIKVVDMDLKAWEGRLVSVSEEAVTIREPRNQQEITVERAKVFRVTDLQRSRRGRNAIIGLIAGGLFFVAAAYGGSAESELPGAMPLYAGIGAVAGAAIPHQRPTIYRTQDKREEVGSHTQK